MIRPVPPIPFRRNLILLASVFIRVETNEGENAGLESVVRLQQALKTLHDELDRCSSVRDIRTRRVYCPDSTASIVILASGDNGRAGEVP